MTLFAVSCAKLPIANKPEDIKTSPNDTRAYRSIILDNQLPVLLVSDPNTDKASAAMDVNVGSAQDPKEFEGLAHFTEHMLFLGTQKYPNAGEYQTFISQHGGSHNAFTAYEDTNFFFDIQPDYLEPALDRFAQQFAAPLFTAKYVDREKHAVHSEFAASIRDDGRRYYSALKAVLNPEHPFSRFSVGNLKTLADRPDEPVRDAMMKFYQKYYSANQMRLVIYGKQDLNTLEGWARAKFSSIPNHDRKVEHKKIPLIQPDKLPALLTVEPNMDRRTLSLLFPMDSIRPFYRSKPDYYLSNLIGHEGAGSLLSGLKQKGWADGLSSGTAVDNPEEAVMNISITLTEEGLKHYMEVVQDTFAYIDLIRKQGINRWRFDEQAKLLDIAFRFQERSNPIHFTSSLAAQLQDYPATDVLYAPFEMDQYDTKVYENILNELTPQNVLITLMAKGVKTDHTSKWYDAAYGFRKLTADEQKLIDSAPNLAIHLPEPNPFIPGKLEMLSGPDFAKPIPLKVNDKLESWYSLDTSFKTPRDNFYVSVRSPLANSSAKNAVLTELYVRLASDALDEFTYPASLAGLDYEVYKHVRGFTLRVEGYSDKQALLLARILDTLTSLKPTQERFGVNYDALRRELENAQQAKPYERGISEVRKMLIEPYWNEQQQLEALKTITLSDLQSFIPKLLGQTKVVTLAHGNISEENAKQLNELVLNKLVDPSRYIDVPKSQVVDINKSSNWYDRLKLDHNDTGFTWYIQGPDKSYVSRAKYALLAQVMATPYYQDVRTDKQMGYIVFATPLSIMNVPGLGFIVQSPSAAPEQLFSATNDFLTKFESALKAMPAATFAQHQQALIANLLEKPKNLAEKSGRYWIEIDDQNPDFDTMKQIAAEVAKTSLPDLIAYYHQQLIKAPKSLLVFNRGAIFPEKQKRPWGPKGFKEVSGKDMFLKGNQLFPN